MRIPRGLLLIASLLLLVCISNAVAQIIDDMENHDSDLGVNILLEKRQDNGNSTATRDGDDPDDNTPSSTQSDDTPSETTKSSSSSSTRPTQTSSTPPSTSQTPTSTRTTSSQETSRTTRRTTTPSTTASPTVSITVVTVRVGTSQSLSTSSTLIPAATDTTVNSSPNAGDDSGSSGLSKTQKNIVIGVVVGVGGAIILGALAIVLWRARKKGGSNIDQDDLMRNNGSPLSSSGREMHSTSPDASPFQATLDQYHKAPGPVNAASNF